jgi:hypothetical protein
MRPRAVANQVVRVSQFGPQLALVAPFILLQLKSPSRPKIVEPSCQLYPSVPPAVNPSTLKSPVLMPVSVLVQLVSPKP